MFGSRHKSGWVVAMVTALCAAGCGRDSDPAQPVVEAENPVELAADAQPTAQPAEEPENQLISPESEHWTRAEALNRLGDESAAVAAAVRLVRLAGATPLCVPDPLPNEFAERLEVLALGECGWVLGVQQSREVRAPVLIAPDGEVTLPVEGVEEEAARLYASEDSDVFPHLLITPLRVMLIGETLTDALVGKDLGGTRFAYVHNDGYPYVVLELPPGAAGDEGTEVARYNWDPYELMFLGPLADKLPEPPGGRFELDLEASRALVPVGGEIPEPPETPEPPPEPNFVPTPA